MVLLKQTNIPLSSIYFWLGTLWSYGSRIYSCLCSSRRITISLLLNFKSQGHRDQFGTAPLAQKNEKWPTSNNISRIPEKQCPSGTHDFLVGTPQNVILQVSLTKDGLVVCVIGSVLVVALKGSSTPVLLHRSEIVKAASLHLCNIIYVLPYGNLLCYFCFAHFHHF
jgi:hypothetical protein